MSIISKELLSEVLGVHVRDGWYFDCELLLYTYDKILGLDENYHAEINIYELAHKCKEWAWSNHKLSIISGYTISGNIVANIMIKHMNMCEHHHKADTEPEAIFKACEWILKDKR